MKSPLRQLIDADPELAAELLEIRNLSNAYREATASGDPNRMLETINSLHRSTTKARRIVKRLDLKVTAATKETPETRDGR